MTEAETVEMINNLLAGQKSTFDLVWGGVGAVVLGLVGAVGVLFKMYISANDKRAENEKAHLKSLQQFSDNIKDLNTTIEKFDGNIEQTNRLVQKVLDILNNNKNTNA